MTQPNVDIFPGQFDDAACFDDPGIMYPDVEPGANNGRNDPYAKARKVCARCPCKEDCKEYVLSLRPRPKLGMFGGMTPTEINKEARRRFRERRDGQPHI